MFSLVKIQAHLDGLVLRMIAARSVIIQVALLPVWIHFRTTVQTTERFTLLIGVAEKVKVVICASKTPHFIYLNSHS